MTKQADHPRHGGPAPAPPEHGAPQRAGAGPTATAPRRQVRAASVSQTRDVRLVLAAVQESAREAGEHDAGGLGADVAFDSLEQNLRLAIEVVRPLGALRSPELNAVVRTTLSELARFDSRGQSIDAKATREIGSLASELREVLAARGGHAAKVGYPAESLEATDRARLAAVAVRTAAGIAERHAASIRRVEAAGVSSASHRAAAELTPAMTHAGTLIASAGKGLSHSELAADLSALSSAIDTIFTESRAGNVSQRDSGLESLFDAEDALLLAASSPIGRRGRTDAYYDANLSSGNPGQKVDPNAHSDHLLKGGAAPSSGRPRTRDDLVGDIVRFHVVLANSLERAHNRARDAIKEPPQPRDPSTLETLLMMAIEQVFVGVGAAVATGVRMAAQSRNDLIRVERSIASERSANPPTHVHAPDSGVRRELSEMEIEVLREFAKDATKSQGRKVSGSDDGNPKPRRRDSLRLESRYLQGLDERTGSMISEIRERFEGHKTELRRLPLEDLEAVADSLDTNTANAIASVYADKAVIEWTNLVARASHDAAGTSIALDHNAYGMVERQPRGVVRVLVSGHDHDLRITEAALDMPNDEVVTYLASMGGSLAELAVHRLIVHQEMYSQQLWMVDPSGAIRGIEGNDRPDGMSGRFHDAKTSHLLALLKGFPVERVVTR